jgi:tRNA-dihydrouridine synthase B
MSKCAVEPLRTYNVFPPLALAPMVGVSHSALRTLVQDFGGVGLLFTEMLAARRLPSDSPTQSPYLVRTPGERPLIHQLLVHEESSIAAAIHALHRLRADGIDLNLGCPAPRVREMGGGSALAASPQRVGTMVQAVRALTSLPLSAKIRLGKRLDEAWLLDFCQMLEQSGVDLLTVHARLERENFNRPPHWDWVGKVKTHLTIPVLANGGIDSVSAARTCLEVSGADGLMIGRAAVVRPWIFAEIHQALYGGPPVFPLQLSEVFHRFTSALEQRFHPERRLGRLKEFTHYFARNFAFGHHLASAVQSAEDWHQAVGRAEAFLVRNDQLSRLDGQ